jgi:type VI secretion system Hcp family effector
MPTNVFLTLFDKADGESTQKGKEKWIDVRGWSWSVDAQSSWTKGGGASVGKPNPGKLVIEQLFNTASPTMLGYICTGKAFPKAELQMTRTSGRGTPATFLTMTLEGLFITHVTTASTEDGQVVQKIEMVYKTVKIEYKPQKSGTTAPLFTWNIPAGTASPSA